MAQSRLQLPQRQPIKRPYILRLRVADCEDKDFIEMEYDRKLTYRDLIETVCSELGIEKYAIDKLRKLPDVRIQCDEDVQRFNKIEHVEAVILPYQKAKTYPYQLD